MPCVHEKISGMLHDVEEATAYAFSYMLDEKMLRSSSHSSFLDFLHLLEMQHPSHRMQYQVSDWECKIAAGLNEMVAWQPASTYKCVEEATVVRSRLTSSLLGSLRWKRSRLQVNDFLLEVYCGLWLLLHSLTVRVQEFEATFAKLAIEAFVDDFYKCDHCRDHFRNATTRSQASPRISKRDLVLWLWRIHNMITEVVASEEHKTEGNSSKLWPAENDCPACRDKTSSLTFDWDEEAVYYYLLDFYGPSPQNPGNGMKVRPNLNSNLNSLQCIFLIVLFIFLQKNLIINFFKCSNNKTNMSIKFKVV
nr:sulfhydryl oxidase 1-like isoform X1 [Physcomitrium patens]XP_024392304.1 sulfhydryl oxidase 1-like isoform X1 [Physcomitrium patens]XP_024392311.1 sulfhydryl oxidase 1-like isoform X1 [Physcomitrium patens]XP_024392319.1 sulfhydryl oxidase 1-like isoform X1 [Physcomitrium patens]XP_024392326.1 sulfhydryl oxidase 1-like isoform X1 [Physcomitrium patens]XP_024392334.1 sulfhydryl oxidase 1-like isoform X1 [Physcomitrium patens]XP_024392343.1 sulfhydryl oxidase 1-like isoform X1 [Physcomitriu|eukprot:XP_024392299.1 sulfhydryl oxidase 1-like isoform X1 [Physcomitrella patens]